MPPAGRLLRDARKAAGVTQLGLAGLLGASQATVSRLEAGLLAITLEQAEAAASALGLGVESLLGSTRARSRVHRRRGAPRRGDSSARLAAAVLGRAPAEFVRRGGSLRAARLAAAGQQPLAAGQAALAVASLREVGAPPAASGPLHADPAPRR